MAKERTLLITGAAGNIGKKLREYLKSRYQLRLTDLNTGGDNAITKLDLGKWSDELVELFEDVDTVIHMAADPNNDHSWPSLISPNLDALINVFMAAEKAAVRRLIYASSNHAMGGYKDKPEVKLLSTNLPALPGTRYQKNGQQIDSTAYGALKLVGERLGKCFAEASQMSVIAIRIGWVQWGENLSENLPKDVDEWFRLMWLSNQDLCQLVEKSIEANIPEPFIVINGMSNNTGMVWDIEYTKKMVGYQPRDGRVPVA